MWSRNDSTFNGALFVGFRVLGWRLVYRMVTNYQASKTIGRELDRNFQEATATPLNPKPSTANFRFRAQAPFIRKTRSVCSQNTLPDPPQEPRVRP